MYNHILYFLVHPHSKHIVAWYSIESIVRHIVASSFKRAQAFQIQKYKIQNNKIQNTEDKIQNCMTHCSEFIEQGTGIQILGTLYGSRGWEPAEVEEKKEERRGVEEKVKKRWRLREEVEE